MPPTLLQPARGWGLVMAVLCVTPVLQRGAPEAPITITAAARSMQPGELVALTIATVEPADTVRARGFDHDLFPFKIDAKTWRVLVGIDLDVTPGTHPVAVDATTAGRTTRATHNLLVRTKLFPTRTLKVDEAFVNPPASVTARIAEEARLLERCWAESAHDRLWVGPFVRPVPQPANSAFGTRSVFNGQARGAHAGADFLSPAGTPVTAPNGGRVVLARDLYYSGNTVIVDHGLGLFSFFAHFSVIGVHEGDVVRKGDVLGRVGATGRVTGPHLHWAVRLNGARVDPLSVLAMLGDK